MVGALSETTTNIEANRNRLGVGASIEFSLVDATRDM